MRTWYNGIYVTYYQESNSFQYVLRLRYDNWYYSKHARNRILLKGKIKDRLKDEACKFFISYMRLFKKDSYFGKIGNECVLSAIAGSSYFVS